MPDIFDLLERARDELAGHESNIIIRSANAGPITAEHWQSRADEIHELIGDINEIIESGDMTVTYNEVDTKGTITIHTNGGHGVWLDHEGTDLCGVDLYYMSEEGKNMGEPETPHVIVCRPDTDDPLLEVHYWTSHAVVEIPTSHIITVPYYQPEEKTE